MITEVQQKRLELEGIRALKQLRIINEKHNFLPTYIEINDSSGYRTEGNGWKGRIITFLPKLYRNLIAIVSYKLPSVWEDPNPLETEERLKSWERDAAEIGLVKVLDENDILADYNYLGCRPVIMAKVKYNGRIHDFFKIVKLQQDSTK